MEKPRALAMIMCDEVIEDKRSHKKSLIGMFNQIVTATFPAKHPKMYIFFALTNGRGLYQAKLQLTSLQDLSIVSEIQGEVEFEDPNAVLEYNFELLNLLFPIEGKYSFQLLLSGNVMIERVLRVAKTKQ